MHEGGHVRYFELKKNSNKHTKRSLDFFAFSRRFLQTKRWLTSKQHNFGSNAFMSNKLVQDNLFGMRTQEVLNQNGVHFNNLTENIII